MTQRIRFTISTDPEVYEAFADLAHTSGVSLSRCIGDWLRDTAEAAQITTLRLKEVRKSPQDALHVFLRDAIVPVMEEVRTNGNRWVADEVGGRRRLGASASSLLDRGAEVPAQPVPPSSNTGGKSPGKTRTAP